MANKTEIVSTVNVETGEYGEFIVSKEVTSQNFIKVFMADFLLALGILNSKSVKVVCYILENVKYSDNTFLGTKKQIAKGCGVSEKTVYSVLRKLQQVDFMKRKSNGVYLINPKFVIKGNENKRQMIINYYKNDTSAELNEDTDAE